MGGHTTAPLHGAVFVPFHPAPNFLWDSACKARVRVPASTQRIHREIIILLCFKQLSEQSLNYFSGNRSGLNVFIPLLLLVLAGVHRALVTDEHSHGKVFSSLKSSSCFHIGSPDRINKNQGRMPGFTGGEDLTEEKLRLYLECVCMCTYRRLPPFFLKYSRFYRNPKPEMR